MIRGLSIIFLVMMFALNSCTKPQAFEYRSIKHMELKHLGFNKTVVLVDLAYYNPNDFGVTLRKVDCEVFLNQNFLGKYVLDTTMHIGSKSTFVIPASVEFDMGDLLKRGASILFNKEALIGVKGTTRIGKFGFYRNIPIQYETKYKLPF